MALVTFASVLGLTRTWQREREEGGLQGLIVAPIARSAIFAGKALGVFAFITAVELVVIPAAACFSASISRRYARALCVTSPLFANVGIAATGTLFGAMTVRTRARDLVLASVLLPLLAPTLGQRHRGDAAISSTVRRCASSATTWSSCWSSTSSSLRQVLVCSDCSSRGEKPYKERSNIVGYSFGLLRDCSERRSGAR